MYLFSFYVEYVNEESTIQNSEGIIVADDFASAMQKIVNYYTDNSLERVDLNCQCCLDDGLIPLPADLITDVVSYLSEC